MSEYFKETVSLLKWSKEMDMSYHRALRLVQDGMPVLIVRGRKRVHPPTLDVYFKERTRPLRTARR